MGVSTVSPSRRRLGWAVFVGAGFCRGYDALSELWWPAWSDSGAERSGLDRSLFERGWFSGRSPGDGSGSSADRSAKRSEGLFYVCLVGPHRV